MTDRCERSTGRDAGTTPDRNLALELVRVTEAAAMAAGRWVGRGDKIAADQAAVDAMRLMLDTVAMDGIVVIGEGEKDEAPMLYNGEDVGTGTGPEVDVAVDPLEGTRLTRSGQPNAIAVDRGRRARDDVLPRRRRLHGQDRRRPRGAPTQSTSTRRRRENVSASRRRRGSSRARSRVVVLERDRHKELIEALRAVGRKVLLIPDGDVAPAIAAAQPGTGVDLLMGVGGTPEGVISAAALKCVGGALQGKLWPRDDEERQKLVDEGFDLERVLTTDDLVARRRGLLRRDRRDDRRAAPRRPLHARRRRSRTRS